MNAMFTNRVGDFFLTLGFFALFYIFGSLDFTTVFSLAPYINVNIITFISLLLLLGAAAKSAQIGLHGWLPFAMDGNIFIDKIHAKLKKVLIFNEISKYLIFNLMIRRYLNINNKNYNNLNNNFKDALIGDLLGDGHIRYPSNGKTTRMEFTFSKDNLPYLNYLKFIVYSEFCTQSRPTPWPNPKSGKPITQYWFSTRYLPIFKELHNQWYKEVSGKYIKIIPFNIKEILKPRGLAHWIMGDGYWLNDTVYLCTDCYTKEEVILLIETLKKNFNIISGINKRKRENGIICWRIRISKLSVNKLRDIIIPFMIPEMLYKLNIK